MIPMNIREIEKLGVMYLRLEKKLDTEINMYFNGVSKLQELHRSGILLTSIKGYYLSFWKDGSIRFSYFTNKSNDSEKFLNDKFSAIGFKKYLPSHEPQEETFKLYLGHSKSNLEFRRFLILITNIGMDLIQYDINYSRCLVAKYRLEIAPLGIKSKTYFELAFKKLPYYNSLTSNLQSELFNGLDYWYTSWEDWAHMLVVMLLPGDLIYDNRYRKYFNTRKPIDRKTREFLSSQLGLSINDWQP